MQKNVIHYKISFWYLQRKAWKADTEFLSVLINIVLMLSAPPLKIQDTETKYKSYVRPAGK